MEIWIFIAMLVAASVALSFVLRKLFERKPPEEKEEEPSKIKILKTSFLEYGEVKWLIRYQINSDDSEDIAIETLPYCKECSTQYRASFQEKGVLKNLHCPSCGNIKRGYPLSSHYHTICNLAEPKIKELKKHLKS